MEALGLMAHRRAEIEGLLHESLFADELYAAAFTALRAATSIGEALEAADPGAAGLLQRVAVEEAEADPGDVAALLARSAAMRRLDELEVEARHSERPGEIAAVVGWLKLSLEELEESDTRAEATERLVAWLAERPQEGL